MATIGTIVDRSPRPRPRTRTGESAEVLSYEVWSEGLRRSMAHKQAQETREIGAMLAPLLEGDPTTGLMKWDTMTVEGARQVTDILVTNGTGNAAMDPETGEMVVNPNYLTESILAHEARHITVFDTLFATADDINLLTDVEWDRKYPGLPRGEAYDIFMGTLGHPQEYSTHESVTEAWDDPAAVATRDGQPMWWTMGPHDKGNKGAPSKFTDRERIRDFMEFMFTSQERHRKRLEEGK